MIFYVTEPLYRPPSLYNLEGQQGAMGGHQINCELTNLGILDWLSRRQATQIGNQAMDKLFCFLHVFPVQVEHAFGKNAE